jgi:hypothetical protein
MEALRKSLDSISASRKKPAALGPGARKVPPVVAKKRAHG